MRITNEILSVQNINMEQIEESTPISKQEEIKDSGMKIQTEEIKIPMAISDSIPPELKEAFHEFYEKGNSIDIDTLQLLKTYINKYEGSKEEKIEAVKMLLAKELEINLTNLKSIYEALYGKDLSENLETIIEISDIKDLEIRDYKNQVFEETSQTIDKIDLIGLLQQIKNMRTASISLDQISDFIEINLKKLDIDIDLSKVLLKTVNEMRQAINYRMEDMAEKILNKTINEISKTLERNQEISDEDISKDRILEENNKIVEKEIWEREIEDYVKSSLSTLTISGKDYIVTEITKRLKNIAENFKEIKLEITRNLDMTLRHIKEGSRSDIQNAHNILEKTIEQLDKTILKSDITLFTDMKTEKELVRASGDLAKAKGFLEKGNYEKAWQLTDKVKDLFEKMNWRPSHSKIIHYGKSNRVIEEARGDKEILRGAVKNYINTVNQGKGSGRMLYEALRLLGADHEGETARFLAMRNAPRAGDPAQILTADDISKEDIEFNIKSSLLKILENNPDQKDSSMAQIADKITGQQLLSKSDKGQFQTMFLNLPIIIGGSLKDAKLYINSRKEKEKLDWENCSIYFLIETDRLGETGILLNSTGRNVSIKIRNDRADLEDKVKPLIANFKKNLIELGYEVGNISFSKLKNDDMEADKPKREKPQMRNINSSKKGFDAKV